MLYVLLLYLYLLACCTFGKLNISISFFLNIYIYIATDIQGNLEIHL